MSARFAALAAAFVTAGGAVGADFDPPVMTPDPPPLVRRVEALERWKAEVDVILWGLQRSPVATLQFQPAAPAVYSTGFPLRPSAGFTYESGGGVLSECVGGQCSTAGRTRVISGNGLFGRKGR